MRVCVWEVYVVGLTMIAFSYICLRHALLRSRNVLVGKVGCGGVA